MVSYGFKYLRRIRLPRWEKVSDEIRQMLFDAAFARDLEACNEAAFQLYGLTESEIKTIKAGDVL